MQTYAYKYMLFRFKRAFHWTNYEGDLAMAHIYCTIYVMLRVGNLEKTIYAKIPLQL